MKSKLPLDGGVGGKAWVCAGRAEQIESEECLGDEKVPLLGGEVGFARGKSSAKMILECANRMFGRVAAMCVWGETLGELKYFGKNSTVCSCLVDAVVGM